LRTFASESLEPPPALDDPLLELPAVVLAFEEVDELEVEESPKFDVLSEVIIVVSPKPGGTGNSGRA